MTAAYDLCAGEGANLTPEIPAAFPWPGAYRFLCHLNVTDRVAFFRETSFCGMIAESADDFLVLILGTHNALEWIEDIVAFTRAWTTADGCACNVEQGFSQVYQEIFLAGSDQTLATWLAQVAKGPKPVHVVGHSLGAAVGAIAAADCARGVRFTLFAMPKPGDMALSRHLAEKAATASIIVRNVQDIVPMQPPQPVYQSVLEEAWFNSDELGVSGDVGDRHRMPTCYLPACTP